jgi:hypothetical protein
MLPVVMKLVLVIVLVLIAEDELRAVGIRISRSVLYKMRCSSSRVTPDDNEEDMLEKPICP